MKHREGIGAPWRLIRASPGDWVFMPRNWWHQVYATPGSVMLSFYAEAPRQQHYK
jgi:quercetin dioxygenase-like cupin family protein